MTEEPTMLGGRYQLDQVIGRGGMAEVWRAADVRLGRDVAVKRLRVDLATDPTFQARFRREAQSAAGLNHPNIVATYDTGEEPDEKTGIHVPYIVMELVEGHTLRDLLRTDRRILPEKALEWSMGVLDALNYSHRAGIIHRDIKPANVMLTPAGTVKVMDFGIARAVADTSATMTQTAAVIGTAQYLSPEQARGETVDSRSDIYSAGCLLYELLTGRPPFVGDSPVSVAYQHVREAPVAPSILDPELTPEMDAIVLKSLAKLPGERYQTAKEMRDDIARLLAGQQISASLPSLAPTAAIAAVPAAPQWPTSAQTAVADAEEPTTEPAPQHEKKKRSPLGWLIALMLALLVGIGGYAVYTFTHNDAAPTVTVPGVVGQNELAATSALEGSGFQVKSTHVHGDAKTANQVTDQNPGAGQQATKGSAVAITVNDGPVTNKVPANLVGMTESDARTALGSVGFVAANVTTQAASAEQEAGHLDFKAGQVVATNPAPGADVVPATQKVVLYLATGKSQVPNVRGKTLDEAKKALAAAGFSQVKVTTVAVTDTAQAGLVQKQDPTDGGQLARTSTITLSIGEMVEVPNVVGMPETEARDKLTRAGFKAKVTTKTVADQRQDGLVQSQEPADGQAAPGSTVAITVGAYQAPSGGSTGGDNNGGGNGSSTPDPGTGSSAPAPSPTPTR